jgi:hypothetical protein
MSRKTSYLRLKNALSSLYLSKTIFVDRFYKILVIEPTREVTAVSIGAPSVKEMGGGGFQVAYLLSDNSDQI